MMEMSGRMSMTKFLGAFSYMVYQFKYDSVHGVYKGTVRTDGTCLIIDGEKIIINQQLSKRLF